MGGGGDFWLVTPVHKTKPKGGGAAKIPARNALPMHGPDSNRHVLESGQAIPRLARNHPTKEAIADVSAQADGSFGSGRFHRPHRGREPGVVVACRGYVSLGAAAQPVHR